MGDELWYRRTGEAHGWTDKAVRWIARRLPARLRYWVVVDAYARASYKFPNAHPDELGRSRVCVR